MRLLPSLGRVHGRPAADLGRAGEDGAEELEDEELEAGPFAHGVGDDPARVGVVDDNFAFLGRGCDDLLGEFLDGVHFYEFGDVVSGYYGLVCCLDEGDGVVENVHLSAMLDFFSSASASKILSSSRSGNCVMKWTKDVTNTSLINMLGQYRQ